MIKGYDISHYNYKNYKTINDADFIIIKATEGILTVDEKINEYSKYFNSTPKGYYHYAHPERNSAEIEAYHFVETLRAFHLLPSVLILDWEDKALTCSISWALQWLNYVYRETGIKPLIYCQRSYVKNLSIILERDFGLWVASPSKKPTKKEIYPYPYFSIWQSKINEHGIDTDYFNGTVDQFKHFGKM